MSPGLTNRFSSAIARNGWRILSIALVRAFALWPRARSLRVRLLLASIGPCKVHPSVSFGRRLHLSVPTGPIELGRGTVVSDDCGMLVSANPRAELRVGQECYLAPHVHLCASRSLVIGNNVRIGEFTSVRDSSHRYRDREQRIDQQGDELGTIVIGDDVWIGRGCLILGSAEGVTLGQGCVVGANSVVRQSVPPYAVVAGAPARVIGERGASSSRPL